MSSTQLQVDTAQFGPASERLTAVGEGIATLESHLRDHTWNPADAWRTAATFKALQASGEASLLLWGLSGIAATAHGLAGHLLQAQQWYEQADAQIVESFATLSDQVTTALVLGIVDVAALGTGALVGALMGPAGISLLLTGAVAYHGLDQAGLVPGGEDLAAWFAENQHVLANPTMVMIVRTLTSGGDELIAEVAGDAGGAAGLVLFGPLGGALAKTLIRQGITSPQSAAGNIADVIQHARGNHQYKFDHTEREPLAAPESIGDLMRTIPTTDPEGTHITVSEYLAADGSTVYVVSVAGTSATGFGGADPMDNLSNLAAYAGQDDETIGATIDAMEQAGIVPGDTVVFSGYSQGALVVAELAASEEWNTASVLLAGSPIHGNAIGGDIPVVQLEHSGDLITGLQGITAPAAGEVAVVHRNPYPSGVPQDQGILGPHMLKTYVETADLYDSHGDVAANTNRDAVLNPLVDATPVATHDFHLEREYPDAQHQDQPTQNAPSSVGNGVESVLEELSDYAGEQFQVPLDVPLDPVAIPNLQDAVGLESTAPDMPIGFRPVAPKPGI
ncbi:MAG: hypothetical protein ACTHXA_05490 [Gulosibacter sp.]|uniref:hypothetical protein n=1 Tax=Gulosibacter sp. TaxID=2817531 RepID=UPI003F8F8D83